MLGQLYPDQPDKAAQALLHFKGAAKQQEDDADIWESLGELLAPSDPAGGGGVGWGAEGCRVWGDADMWGSLGELLAPSDPVGAGGGWVGLMHTPHNPTTPWPVSLPYAPPPPLALSKPTTMCPRLILIDLRLSLVHFSGALKAYQRALELQNKKKKEADVAREEARKRKELWEQVCVGGGAGACICVSRCVSVLCVGAGAYAYRVCV